MYHEHRLVVHPASLPLAGDTVGRLLGVCNKYAAKRSVPSFKWSGY